MRCGAEMNMPQFVGSKGQRSGSQWKEICWKLHFLGLLIRFLEKYESDFHQTYTNDVLWHRSEALNFGFKRSQFKVMMK